MGLEVYIEALSPSLEGRDFKVVAWSLYWDGEVWSSEGLNLETRPYKWLFNLVKVVYGNLGSLVGHPENRHKHVLQGLIGIWKSYKPSKFSVFSWKLLSTRKNLRRRQNVSSGSDVRCVVCGGHVKSINHIFVLGEITSVI